MRRGREHKIRQGTPTWGVEARHSAGYHDISLSGPTQFAGHHSATAEPRAMLRVTPSFNISPLQ